MNLHHRLYIIIIGVSMLLPSHHAQAATCSAKSGPTTVAVVELYTSEGCSSCPPADKWLSELRSNGFGLDRVIPLALHVDYWDYIGWKDPYAKPLFAARQREIAARQNSSTVYTPQILLNGKDYRPRSWFASFEKDVKAINQTKPGAELTLTFNQPVYPELELSLTGMVLSSALHNSPHIYIAFYESMLSNQVRRGENSGRLLQHDHVVREWFGPFKVSANGKIDMKHIIALKSEWKIKDSGIVAFVQNEKTGDILQALALPMCGG